jgi:hypothetical protein
VLWHHIDSDRYGAQEDAPEFGAATWTIDTEIGSWRGEFTTFRSGTGEWASTTFPMAGIGAYEGLVAITSVGHWMGFDTEPCSWSISGYVADDDILAETPIRVP